jgi:hypothetical protein
LAQTSSYVGLSPGVLYSNLSYAGVYRGNPNSTVATLWYEYDFAGEYPIIVPGTWRAMGSAPGFLGATLCVRVA